MAFVTIAKARPLCASLSCMLLVLSLIHSRARRARETLLQVLFIVVAVVELVPLTSLSVCALVRPPKLS